MRKYLTLPVLAVVIAFAACERKADPVVSSTPMPEPVARTSTLETTRLGDAIDRYERQPTAENKAEAEKALADLDGEIAELKGKAARFTGSEKAEAEAKLTNLVEYREKQALRLQALAAGAAVGITPENVRTGKEKMEEGAARAASKMEEGARKAGDAIERAGEKLNDAIKDATQ